MNFKYNKNGVLEYSRNKDKQFWEYIQEFYVIGLVETWIEKEHWSKLKEVLYKKFHMEMLLCDKRKNKRKSEW